MRVSGGQLFWLLIWGVFAAHGAEPDPERVDRIFGFLDSYCIDCHDSDFKKGGLDMDLVDWADHLQTHEVFHMARSGSMPPAKKDQPDKSELTQFLDDIAALSDHKVTEPYFQRRLTKTEYFNALEDLLDITIGNEIRGRFPDEVSDGGFDVSSGLGLSQVHLRAYLEIADLVIESAMREEKAQTVVSRNFVYHPHAKRPKIDSQETPVVRIKAQPRTANGVPFPYFRHGFICESAGWYEVEYTVTPVDRPATILLFGGEYVIDGALVVQAPRLLDATEIDGKTKFTKTVWLEKDDEVAFSTVQGIPVDFGNPVTIQGPLHRPSRLDDLAEIKTVDQAKSWLLDFARLAYRMPLSTADLTAEWQQFDQVYGETGNIAGATRSVLQHILCSPEFLYKRQRHDAFSFAETLALLLWRSVPDASLLAAAQRGELHGDRLASEVERLLDSPKSERWAKDFSFQWLQVNLLESLLPDYQLYPDYDAYLAWSMEQETWRSLMRLVAENRPANEVIDADWLILNNRLAQHYGITGVQGANMRVVARPKDSVRGGFLTQASVMAATADGAATSPVKRGVWLIEKIAGIHVPPPPEDVPDIPVDSGSKATVLEKLEIHRAAKDCRGCHSIIDGYGVPFEQFDPIGGLRTHYHFKPRKGVITLSGNRKQSQQGAAVVATYDMADGTSVDGVVGLKQYLMGRDHQVVRTTLEKLVQFGIGRDLNFEELNLIDHLSIQASQTGDPGMRDLIDIAVNILSKGKQ